MAFAKIVIPDCGPCLHDSKVRANVVHHFLDVHGTDSRARWPPDCTCAHARLLLPIQITTKLGKKSPGGHLAPRGRLPPILHSRLTWRGVFSTCREDCPLWGRQDLH